jgi:hypothetical protein
MSFRVSPPIWLAALCLLLLAIPARAASTTLSVPGRASATPSIAADGQFVAVVWGGTLPDGATDVFLAVSRDGGRAFGTPVRVNNVPGDARLNGEQPPHVGVIPRTGADPAIIVVWTTKGPKGSTLLQSRSDDGGRTFTSAAIVPGTDTAGNRGWEAIAVEPNGRVDAVWLDHRELASDSTMAASHHDHSQHAAAGARPAGSKPDGVAMAQKSKLYFASLDGSAVPRAVTGGVCYCCKTALVGGSGGKVYAAWRHVYPGNLRDMAFTMSRDGGRTFAAPIRVSEDKWVLEGCPDDGPAMVVDGRQRIHVVWPTLVNEQTAPSAESSETIALFYATSSDGLNFTPRQRIPTEGLPHHPRIVAAADGSLTVAWDEQTKGSRRIAVARAARADKGLPSFRRELLTSEGPAIYPALAVAGGDVIAVWTSGTSAESSIQVGRIPVSGEGR